MASLDTEMSRCIEIEAAMAAAEKEEEKNQREEEERLRREEEERAEEELRQQRFKRLMHLLKQSTFYTQFLIEKMNKREQQKQACVKRKTPPVHPAPVKEEVSSPSKTRSLREKRVESNSSTSKRKASPVGAPKKKKINRNGAYDISTIIDKETIRNFKQDSEDKEQAGPSAIPEATRVTAYGHVVSQRQPVLFEGGVLREYQLNALDWLKCLYENGMNGILADEMGLGKTLEVISLVCHLIEMCNTGQFLIVAPLSTIPNWMLEFERFAPKIPVVVYHGSPEERRRVAHEATQRKKVLTLQMYPVVLTSYELPLRDKHFFHRRRWGYIIVDEGHRLKNPNSQLSRTLRLLACENRLLLTGTPLQNNIAELWALLNFLLPEIFDDLELFESWFPLGEVKDNSEKIIEQEEKNQIVSTMHQILTPFLLRRTKADVAISIPPKKEMVVYAPLSPIQHQLYESTLDSSIERLLLKEKDPILEYGPDGKCQKRKCTLKNKKRYSYIDEYSSSDESFSEDDAELDSSSSTVEVVDRRDKGYRVYLTMQNPKGQLRKIVNHPYLIQMPVLPGTKEIRVDEELVNKSGKLMVMDAMLAKLKARGHRVLIFSTYCMILDLLEEYVLLRKYSYCRLDGQTDLEDRKDRIKRFNTDPSMFLFLISTRAGGLGINLTGADTVIIFDSDWNPQVDLQAQDRCHRIGQTKPVVIYRLVAAGTYDEKIVETANAKRKLEKLIIQKDRFRLDRLNFRNLMSLKELKELLNSTDQRVVQPNGYVFTDEELEALLDRSDLVAGSKSKMVNSASKIFKKVAA